MEKDLANIKKLASLLEDEASELRRLPEVLAEPRDLLQSQGGELSNGLGTAESGGVTVAKAENGVDGPPLESDQMVGDDPREPKNRGSNAVEDRIEYLSAEMMQEVTGDSMPESEAAFQAKKVRIGFQLGPHR